MIVVALHTLPFPDVGQTKGTVVNAWLLFPSLSVCPSLSFLLVVFTWTNVAVKPLLLLWLLCCSG